MSTLTLLRHGQASFGADRYDTLSDRGREQSERVGAYLVEHGRHFDRVWIGPRDRHRLTARHSLGPLGVDWAGTPEEALNEFAEGQQILSSAQARRGVQLRGEGAIRGKEAARYYAQEIDAWAHAQVDIPDVPAVGAFRVTVAQWLERATTESAAPGQSIIAVTSGGVIAAVMAEVLRLPDAAIGGLMHAIYNGSLSEFQFSAGRPPSLVSFNVASFLPDDLLTRV
jgi:broad specificity phosphatase PhoE